MKSVWAIAVALAACGQPRPATTTDAAGNTADSRWGSGADAQAPTDDGRSTQADAAAADAAVGPVTGGPCASTTTGATLLRIRFDADAQGEIVVVYEADGTPGHAGYAGVYGYTIPYTAFYDNTFGGGGLSLDSTDFVDLTAPTTAISHITTATLSIFGTASAGTSGYDWQSFVGSGATSPSFVTDALPYTWFSSDVTSAIDAGNAHYFIRLKTLDSENAIIVKKIELCVVAS